MYPYFIRLTQTAVCVLLLWCPVLLAGQPTVTVAGSAQPRQIKALTNLYFTQLGVHERLYLSIRFTQNVSQNFHGITLQMPSSEPEKYSVFRILIDSRMSRRQQMLVLAHELVHVKQYVKGELLVDPAGKVVWKGKQYHYFHTKNRVMPWETEAHKLDSELAYFGDADLLINEVMPEE